MNRVIGRESLAPAEGGAGDEAGASERPGAAGAAEAAGATPSPAGVGGGDPAEPRWTNRLALVSVVAAILPIVVATIRAIANGWVATGDNAYFAIRSRDVLTAHHPLLGSWTSASLSANVNMNNPGPLYFDLLAIPVRLGDDAGLAVGVALLNIAAVLGIAVVARRVAGAPGVVTTMLVATGLGWAMGSQLLFDPWQPHSLMLPFLCLLVMTWALATGDLVMLPWLVGLASYIVQTHLGYAVVVTLLAAWGAGWAGARLWRVRHADPEGWPTQRRRGLVLAGIAALVAVACWSQTVYQQLFGPGPGNLGQLMAGSRAEQARVGVGEAPRYVGEVLSLPPWWGRPSITESFVLTLDHLALPTGTAARASLLVLGTLLVAAIVEARRRHDHVAATGVATATVAVVASLVGVATLPLGILGVAPHQLRWLWPVAVFVTAMLALVALTALPRHRAARIGMVAVVVATVALSGLNLPAMNARTGPSLDAEAIPVLRELTPQLEPLADERGALIDFTGLHLFEPYSWPVMSELQELGVPLHVDDAAMVSQFGPARAGRGDASVRVFLREGLQARAPVPGARRVAFAEGELPEAEAAELAALQEQLRPFIAGGGLQLTEQAAAAALAPPPPGLGDLVVSEAQLRDPEYLMEGTTEATGPSRRLVRLVELRWLDVPARWQPELDRYAELQRRADHLTVAVFVEALEEDR